MTRESVRISIAIGGLAVLLSAVLGAAVRDALRQFAQLSASAERVVGSDVRIEGASESPQPVVTSNQTMAMAPPYQTASGSNSGELGEGGDTTRGESIFFQKAEVNCSKCHRIRGRGGEIGPDLTEIGGKRTREELVQSLQNPDLVISEGYHTLMIQTIDGLTLYGVVREDSPQQVRLVDVEGREHTVPVEDIEERRPGRSAMPADLCSSLTPQEIRDLVAYLAACK